ncbi:hypothetical protein Q6334_29800, partial [Klebsiella pneumoniae]|uniref:hypothetical protein n=1 Tax=Klebsiella pneumoniae TaxID=573 RepID=UPI00272F2966
SVRYSEVENGWEGNYDVVDVYERVFMAAGLLFVVCVVVSSGFKKFCMGCCVFGFTQCGYVRAVH